MTIAVVKWEGIRLQDATFIILIKRKREMGKEHGKELLTNLKTREYLQTQLSPELFAHLVCASSYTLPTSLEVEISMHLLLIMLITWDH